MPLRMGDAAGRAEQSRKVQGGPTAPQNFLSGDQGDPRPSYPCVTWLTDWNPAAPKARWETPLWVPGSVWSLPAPYVDTVRT